MKPGLLKNLLGAGLVVLMGATALAQTAGAGSQVPAGCVYREVAVLAKSTPGVHLNEKDEGRVIGMRKILDCGTHIVVEQPAIGSRTGGQVQPGGARICPPNVQDCIAP